MSERTGIAPKLRDLDAQTAGHRLLQGFFKGQLRLLRISGLNVPLKPSFEVELNFLMLFVILLSSGRKNINKNRELVPIKLSKLLKVEDRFLDLSGNTWLRFSGSPST